MAGAGNGTALHNATCVDPPGTDLSKGITQN